MKQVKQVLPTDCMRLLYTSLIQSHLSYGLVAWGNASDHVLNQTKLLQKRAIRVVHNAKYNSHTEPLFKRSNILKLNDLTVLQSVLFMYDYRTGKLPQSFHGYYTTNQDMPNSRHTRQSELYRLPRCRLSLCSRLPFYVLPNTLNNWSIVSDRM